jgi:hypothetical protein
VRARAGQVKYGKSVRSAHGRHVGTAIKHADYPHREFLSYQMDGGIC